ncbi:MAG: hypothetical protein HFK07_00245 [Clostridia bacterium]|nr:hypothetical protein [Clostridia bacterium]MCX4366620.1 hypothetical protein [Clostridia bacterium]
MDSNMNLKENIKSIENASSKIRKFLDGIIDEGSFVETDVFACGKSFIDETEARGEGVITGYATVKGNPVHIFAQNSEVLKGSLGAAHAEKIVRCMKKAAANGTALISVLDSAGARVGEGVEMLEAYAKLVKTAYDVSASIPHIAIVKGNCVGMMSSFINMADFVFMSKEAVMSLSAPMVVASDIKGYPKFNDVLGYSAHSEKSDIAHFAYDSVEDLSDKLSELMEFISADEIEDNDDDPNREAVLNADASVEDILAALCDNSKSIEYAKDYAKDVRCFLAKVNSIPVGIVATDKSVKDGFTSSCGFKKAAKFIDKLDAFNLPLITLVDSKGIKTCMECELKGAAANAAMLMEAIAGAGIPKIAVITGNAIGATYSALASKAIGFDYSLAFDNAVIAPVNSVAAVDMFYVDEIKNSADPVKARAALEKKYSDMEANPINVARQGFVDNIISAGAIRPYVASAILMLLGL